MRIQTRIISAVLLVVAVVNVVYAVYVVKREQRNAMAQLQSTMEENDKLLKVVATGPLYDGNVEQLDAILDSIFANPDIVRVELTEKNGDIKMYRTRIPVTKRGESFDRNVVITRGIDQLGEIQTTYSGARIEQMFMVSAIRLSFFALAMLLLLSSVIYLIARGISGPIERLTESAEDMANGHLNRAISPSGAQELQSLGQSFIRMRDAIRTKMADLAKQNESLRLKDLAIASSVNGIAIADQSGLLTYVNRSFLRIWGYDDPSQVLGKLALDFWQDKEQASRVVKHLHEHGTVTGELIAKKKDGSSFPIELSANLMTDEAGRPSSLIGFFIDITERKQAEDALRESEEKYKFLIETTSTGYVIIDKRGRVVDANQEYIRMTGHSSLEEIAGREVVEWTAPYDLARNAEEVKKCIERGFVRNLVIDYIDHQGKSRPIEINATVMRELESEQIFSICRDISERRRAEEEKDRLESQLLQAQKLESVGRLAGGVAHDFNNMLNVIMGYAELIIYRLPEGDPLSKNAKEIQKAAIRSRDLTRQLLAFSRKQIIAPRPVDLNYLVKDTQNTLARLIGEDIDLQFHPDEALWTISFDPSQFDQILINLAVNARDAMPDGGKLTIETANVRLDDAYCRDHPGFLPGDYVQLMVSDNGIGMDRETLSHVFEPFFTTKEVDKGTGLGLATVYGIIKQNNGFINIYSEPGQGTTFNIYFPRITSQEDAITEKIGDAQVAFGTGTVLLVEDDEMVLSVVIELLRNIGYTVLVAKTPMEALSLLEKTDTPVDLLLTDVVMPGMKGNELRDRARVVRPGIKVLFMSGYTTNIIVHHGILKKGVHFLQKPFSLESLAQKVREAIEDT